MNIKTKRILLFLLGCILLRSIFVIIAKKINKEYLPILGYLALLPAIGFIYIFLTDKRRTGGEVFGNKIWWNNLRPVHASLYIMFALLAIKKSSYAWIPLLIDVLIGITSFSIYHFF